LYERKYKKDKGFVIPRLPREQTSAEFRKGSRGSNEDIKQLLVEVSVDVSDDEPR